MLLLLSVDVVDVAVTAVVLVAGGVTIFFCFTATYTQNVNTYKTLLPSRSGPPRQDGNLHRLQPGRRLHLPLHRNIPLLRGIQVKLEVRGAR